MINDDQIRDLYFEGILRQYAKLMQEKASGFRLKKKSLVPWSREDDHLVAALRPYSEMEKRPPCGKAMMPTFVPPPQSREGNPPLLILGNPLGSPMRNENVCDECRSYGPQSSCKCKKKVRGVNPPKFIVIDSQSGIVQYTKVATGTGDAALRSAAERAQDMADKLGRPFIVFLDLQSSKVGSRMNLPMVRVMGSHEYLPRGQSSAEGLSRGENPLTEAEHRKIIFEAKHDHAVGVEYGDRGNLFQSGVYLGKASRSREIAHNYSPISRNPSPALSGVAPDGTKYVVKKDREWDEWQVVAYVNGKRHEGKTYHASDKADAIGTFNHLVRGGNPDPASFLGKVAGGVAFGLGAGITERVLHPAIYGKRGKNPYSQSESDFIEFLGNRLIPDLYESGTDATADTFAEGVGYARGRSFRPSEEKKARQYADWLESTLIPDMMASGTVEAARDLARLAKIIHRKYGRGKNPQYSEGSVSIGGPDIISLHPPYPMKFQVVGFSLDKEHPLPPTWSLGEARKQRSQIIYRRTSGRIKGWAQKAWIVDLSTGRKFGFAHTKFPFSGREKNPKGNPSKISRAGNPSHQQPPPHIMNDPAFKAELAAYYKRHGKNAPVEIFKVKVPKGFPKFMTAYGQAPATLYDAHKISNKGKRIHKFGEGGKKKPWLVSSQQRGNKFLAYVGGDFRAQPDWIYD